MAVRWFGMSREEKEANLFSVYLLTYDYNWSEAGDLHTVALETKIPYQLLEQYILARGLDQFMKQSTLRELK